VAKGDTLRLLADSYEQPQADDKPSERHLVEYTKGDVFDALSDAEYDRLTEIGAAIDPKVANEQAKAEAEERIASLKAEQDALQSQIDETQAEGNLGSLTKPELVTYLEEHDADTSGTKPELLARAQAIADAE
jgi:hypothetical protein